MVVLDTSIIIDHLRRPPKESILIGLFEKHADQVICISVISVQELYEGKSTTDTVKENQLLSTLSLMEILPYDYEIAKLAGKIARDSKNPIELADAAIAATAIINNADLYTLNQKHFQTIPDLKLAN